MAKQEKAVPRKGAGKVASAVSKTYAAVSKQGNVITQCVSAVAAVYKGEDVPLVDLKFIAERVARERNWSKASETPRKSEVRKIVRNYNAIPEAVKLYQAKHDNFTWHTCMRLVTLLNSNTPRQAVAAMVSPKEKAKIAADKQVTKLLDAIANIDTAAKKVVSFRKALTRLRKTHAL